MKRLRSPWGLGLITMVIAVSSVVIINSQQKNPEPNFEITLQNMVEIRETVELDEYGYNRINAEIEEGKVRRNESLYLILRDLEVSPQVIHEINNKSEGVFRVRTIKPGQKYLAYKVNDEFKRLILQTNALDYVIFDWSDEVTVKTGKKTITTKRTMAEGTIESSLYENLVKQGLNPLLGNRLSEIFAWEIDFFRLYPGDTYKVIYDKQYVDGELFGIGKVYAAEFSNNGQKFDAYYFETDDRAAYYDSSGNGVQKALLKAPFKYSQRVSSNFSYNRFHPVLKRRIPHYGVDYAAPKGTPVLSVGDGEVVEAQYRGASGNIVKIRHNGTYTTAYLHLNGFAKGIRVGKRVKQGQVIGYVGKTGRVTGVHLDYRIYMHGKPVNPLKVKLPPSKAVDTEHMEEFKALVQHMKMQLEQTELTSDLFMEKFEM